MPADFGCSTNGSSVARSPGPPPTMRRGSRCAVAISCSCYRVSIWRRRDVGAGTNACEAARAGKHRGVTDRIERRMDQSRALDDRIDDLATARALIASLQDQLTRSQREIAALRHELDILCQRLFGRKSERVDPRQLKLALEQLANERGPVTEPVEMDSGETPVRGHARRRPTGRRPLPAHLPRRRVEIDVTDAEKQCACGHTRTRIGEDVSEKLEYEPASFVVIETVRPKYACPHCHEGVVEAPAPPQAIEKSLAAEGLLAHVVVSKYVDHLPLHRLERIFAREAIDLPRSTLCDWV